MAQPVEGSSEDIQQDYAKNTATAAEIQKGVAQGIIKPTPTQEQQQEHGQYTTITPGKPVELPFGLTVSTQKPITGLGKQGLMPGMTANQQLAAADARAEVNKNHQNWQMNASLGSTLQKAPYLVNHPELLWAIVHNQDLHGMVNPQDLAGILKAKSLYDAAMKSYAHQTYFDFEQSQLPSAHLLPGLMEHVGGSIQDIIKSIPGGTTFEKDVALPVMGAAGSVLGSHPLSWAQGLDEKAKKQVDGLGPAAIGPSNILGGIDSVLGMLNGLFSEPSHFYRYYETVKQLHGEDAALAATMPMILGAGAGAAVGLAAGATPGAEEAAPELVGVAADVGATAADAAGATSQASAIAKAIQEMKDAAAAVKAAKENFSSQIEQSAAYERFLKAKMAVEKFAAPITRVTKPVTDVTGKVINKYSIGGAELGGQLGGQIVYPDIWKATQDGTKWAKEHPNLAPTFGQAILGRHNFASGVVDFLMSVGGQDPLGAAGSFIGQAKSAEGLGGIFNSMWSGTAFSNVDKAYEQYGGVKRSLDAIVENIDSPTMIARIDPRLNDVAGILSKAKVVDAAGEVDKAATLENVKDAFKQLSAVDEIFTTGKLPMSSAMVLRARMMDTKAKGLFKFMPSFAKFSGHRDEWGVSNDHFTLGDVGVLPALNNGLRHLGFNREIADAVTDHLYKTKDLGEWMNVYRTVVKGKYQIEAVKTLAGARAAAKLAPSDFQGFFEENRLDAFLQELDPSLNEAIDKATTEVMGYGGVNADGQYLQVGRSDLSSVGRAGEEGIRSYRAGVYQDDLGRIRLPNYTTFNKALHDLVDHLHNNVVKELDVPLRVALGDRYAEFATAAAQGYTGTNTAFMQGSDFADEIFAKAILEHEDNLKASDAAVAEAQARVNAGKASELDRRIARNAINRRQPLATNRNKGAYEGVVKRMVAEMSLRNEISDQEASDILAFMRQMGEWMFDGVVLRISHKDFGKLGAYDFTNKMIQIYRNGLKNPAGIQRTMIHEMFHHLSTYLPDEYLTGLHRELQAARSDYIRQGNLERVVKMAKEYGILADEPVVGKAEKDITKAEYVQRLLIDQADRKTAHIQPDDIDWAMVPMTSAQYRLTSIDEWFAESMYDRAAKRLDVHPLVELGHRIMQAIFAGINRVTGYKAGETAFRNFWLKRFEGPSVPNTLENRMLGFDPDIAATVARGKSDITGDELAPVYSAGQKSMKMDRLMESMNYYIDKGQGLTMRGVYAVNSVVNDHIFKPLALATGGWATRVSASEGLLNAMRQGPINMSLSHLAQAGARHERAVQYWGAELNRRGVMDMAARINYVIGTKVFRMSDNNMRWMSSEDEMGAFIATLHGVMAGVESSILKGLGKQEFMDAAIKSLYLNQGHIAPQMLEGGHSMVNDTSIPTKGSVIGQDTSAKDEKPVAAFFHRDRALDGAYYSKRVRISNDTHRAFDPAEDGFVTRRMLFANKIGRDPAMRAALPPMYNAYDAALKGGATRAEAWAEAEKVGVKAHYDFMQSLPEATRKIFVRQDGWTPTDAQWLAEHPGLSPEEAHSQVAIDGLKQLIVGPEHVEHLGGQYHDTKLFSDLANRRVANKTWKQFADTYHADDTGQGFPTGYFSPIVGGASDPLNGNKFSNLFVHFGEAVNEKMTGNIVTRLSREPVFIVDFARELKLLDGKVAAGILTQEQADTMALARASQTMIRFVHNPYDKLKFEYGMRIFAPFYFAQNQAWRRMARLGAVDIGAFERYIKTISQVLNYSYAAGQSQGGYPTVPVPGSAWLVGFVTKFLTGTAVPIGINLSLDSAQSILPISPQDSADPTNALTSPSALLHSLIPRSGPTVNLPLKYLFGMLPLSPAVVQSIDDAVIGQAGESSSMLQDLLPNSFIDHLLQTSAGALGAAWGKNGNNILKGQAFVSSYITASNETWRYIVEQKIQSFKDAVEAQHPKWDTASVNTLALIQFANYYDPRKNGKAYNRLSDLMNEVNQATYMRAYIRSGLGFFTPLSSEMGRANAKVEQQYQNLVSKLKGDWIAAQQQWVAEDASRLPYTILTTTSQTSRAQGISWPETHNALEWMQHNDGLVNSYPAASRFLMPLNTLQSSTNPYYSIGALYQLQNDLRQRRVPEEMQQQIDISIGNNEYYNIILPYYTAQAGGNSYEGYKQAEKWAQTSGLSQNPDWYKAHMDKTGGTNRTLVLQQIAQMLNDPKAKRQPLYKPLSEVYSVFQDFANNVAPMYSSADRGKILRFGGSGFIGLDKIKAKYPDMTPFITDVLEPQYPYYPNG